MFVNRVNTECQTKAPYGIKTMHHYLLSILAFLNVAVTAGADWAQYLGPNRNAVALDAELARSWPDSGPRKLWSFPLGAGHGGASVQGGKVFVLDRIANQRDILRCIDFATGQEKWTFSYDAPGRHSHPGSRSVPTVDDEYVWSVGPFGHFYCIRRKTHQPVWSTHILDEFEAEEPHWGVAQSPLLYRDMVMVAPQGKKGGVVAFDKKTGNLKWASRKLTGIPCYVSPTLANIGGIDQIIMISASDEDDESIQGEVVSFEASNGQALWSYRDFNTFVNIAPPTLIEDGRLFLTNGSKGGHFDPISIMLQVQRKGGAFVVKELFRTGEAAGKMHPPVLHEGYLYFNGIRRPNRMRCLSLAGAVMWDESPDFQLGAFILADGLILNQDGKSGNLHLIEPSPKGYKELAKAELFPNKKGEPWAPLALSNGKLLIRDGRQMICVDLENPN
jgi:outer membrane protein assembly factor BamB